MLPECKETVPLLMRCLSGDYDAESIIRLKFHLETCGTCKDQLRLIQSLMTLQAIEKTKGKFNLAPV